MDAMSTTSIESRHLAENLSDLLSYSAAQGGVKLHSNKIPSEMMRFHCNKPEFT